MGLCTMPAYSEHLKKSRGAWQSATSISGTSRQRGTLESGPVDPWEARFGHSQGQSVTTLQL